MILSVRNFQYTTPLPLLCVQASVPFDVDNCLLIWFVSDHEIKHWRGGITQCPAISFVFETHLLRAFDIPAVSHFQPGRAPLILHICQPTADFEKFSIVQI